MRAGNSGSLLTTRTPIRMALDATISSSETVWSHRACQQVHARWTSWMRQRRRIRPHDHDSRRIRITRVGSRRMTFIDSFGEPRPGHRSDRGTSSGGEPGYLAGFERRPALPFAPTGWSLHAANHVWRATDWAPCDRRCCTPASTCRRRERLVSAAPSGGRPRSSRAGRESAASTTPAIPG
jgi:hypothetical protein